MNAKCKKACNSYYNRNISDVQQSKPKKWRLSLWKSANVSPIPKSSPAQDIDSDFRPISLTAIVSKILKSFPYRWLFQSITIQISTLLSLAHFEAQVQAWRSSNSSISALYEACDDLGPSLRICLLDFSKAFDRIDRNVILRKVQQMAVHPVLINWITDFLSIRLQWTKTGQDYSVWKYIQADVPQGTNLGPLLFFNHGK